MDAHGLCSEFDRTCYERVGVLLSEVEPDKVSWLWYGRIPYGRVTLLDGDPGLGKSTMALDVAARVTTGTSMPNDGQVAGKPSGVVILTAEDSLADTVRPRLDAAGADASRVVALSEVPTAGSSEGHPITLPEDVEELRRAIARVDASLVIVDPLMAFLSPKTNSSRDQSVRHALRPLEKLAEETGVAILVIRHLNKSAGGNPLYRGGGSIAFIAGVRSGLVVGSDPDDGSRRVLASAKCNLALQPESLVFHLDAKNGASHVVWDGVSTHDATRVLLKPSGAAAQSALEEAKEVIADLLADGPMPAKELHDRALAEGVSDHTFRRARAALGCVKDKTAFRGGLTWELPNLPIAPPTCPSLNDGQVRDAWATSDEAKDAEPSVAMMASVPEDAVGEPNGETLTIFEQMSRDLGTYSSHPESAHPASAAPAEPPSLERDAEGKTVFDRMAEDLAQYI